MKTVDNDLYRMPKVIEGMVQQDPNIKNNPLYKAWESEDRQTRRKTWHGKSLRRMSEMRRHFL